MKHFILYLLFAFAMAIGTNAQTSSNQNNSQKEDVVVSVVDNKLYIMGANQGVEFEIKNMLGVVVYQGMILQDGNSRFDIDLKSGFYIVKIGDSLKRIIVK